jgi:hypothetical protein
VKHVSRTDQEHSLATIRTRALGWHTQIRTRSPWSEMAYRQQLAHTTTTEILSPPARAWRQRYGKHLAGVLSCYDHVLIALIDGVRRFAMDVRELDIDLIDRINPFGEAYAILAKTMSEDSLKQVAAAIAAKRTSLTPEEAKELAVRAVKFKKERGRLPSISSTDAWENRMTEGAAAFVRFKDEGRYE